MGYENINLETRQQLFEIARMAYGSGSNEGVKGGAGRMGAMTGPDGKPRVFKFNTHLRERLGGPSKSEEMIRSSNELRSLLFSIAQRAGYEGEALSKIRKELGLKDGTATPKSLLDRTVVAKVVTMIGGEKVWQDAFAPERGAVAKSAYDMKFDVQSARTSYDCKYMTVSGAEALRSLGLTPQALASAMDDLSAKFKLDGAKKARVWNITTAFLASRAEESEAGCGLPPADKLLEEIRNGSFSGTQIALLNVGKLTTTTIKDPTFTVKSDSAATLALRRMDAEKCEFAAFVIGKFAPVNMDDLGIVQWLGPSPLLLHTAFAHQNELLALHGKQGSVSFEDLCKTLGVEPHGKNRSLRQNNLIRDMERKLFDKFSATGIFKDGFDFSDFISSDYDTLIASFGMSPEDAVRQTFGPSESFDIPDDLTMFNLDAEDMGKSVDSLASQLAEDIKRSKGSITINGKRIEYNQSEINPAEPQAYIQKKADEITDALCQMLGCGRNDNPPSKLLKMMLIACAQGGNQILQASGQIMGVDHVATDKSFTMQPDGKIVYVVKSDLNIVNKGVVSAMCEIKPNGDNRLTRFSNLAPDSVAKDLEKVFGERLSKSGKLSPQAQFDLCRELAKALDVCRQAAVFKRNSNDETDYLKSVMTACVRKMPALQKLDWNALNALAPENDTLAPAFFRHLEEASNALREDNLHEGWQKLATPAERSNYVRRLPEADRKFLYSLAMGPTLSAKMLANDLVYRLKDVDADSFEKQASSQDKNILRRAVRDPASYGVVFAAGERETLASKLHIKI